MFFNDNNMSYGKKRIGVTKYRSGGSLQSDYGRGNFSNQRKSLFFNNSSIYSSPTKNKKNQSANLRFTIIQQSSFKDQYNTTKLTEELKQSASSGKDNMKSKFANSNRRESVMSEKNFDRPKKRITKTPFLRLKTRVTSTRSLDQLETPNLVTINKKSSFAPENKEIKKSNMDPLTRAMKRYIKLKNSKSNNNSLCSGTKNNSESSHNFKELDITSNMNF